MADFAYSRMPSRGGAAAARRAHNPKVGGSNPSPATNLEFILNPGSRPPGVLLIRTGDGPARMAGVLNSGGPTAWERHRFQIPHRRASRTSWAARRTATRL